MSYCPKAKSTLQANSRVSDKDDVDLIFQSMDMHTSPATSWLTGQRRQTIQNVSALYQTVLTMRIVLTVAMKFVVTVPLKFVVNPNWIALFLFSKFVHYFRIPAVTHITQQWTRGSWPASTCTCLSSPWPPCSSPWLSSQSSKTNLSI